MYHGPKYAIYDKKVFYCKFCRAPISNPVIYPGKKLMITRYCPHCHSVNSFPLLELQEQKFLRAGFFSNPLYPFTPHPKKGLTSKLSLFLYPVSLFINFGLNIVYMPFGLIFNHIQIKQATKTFFETYSTKDPSVVYLDMLRKRANEGLPYSALLMGRAYLLGEGVPVDLEIAENYIKIAKDEFEADIIALVKALLQETSPDYTKVFRVVSLVSTNPLGAYYLSYLYYYGYGVSPSLKRAITYGTTAFNAKIKDYYSIFDKISLKQ
jgi:hypothetical protein